MNEFDLTLADGRTLHAYDTATDKTVTDTATDGHLAVFWHHGTPNVGTPPEPLLPTADRLGVRFVSYDRPGYGGSTPQRGRDLASAADHVASVADALGIDRFALMGHSGGSSHALAAAAVLRERVLGVVSIAALAPFTAEGLDWFAGMIPSGEAALRASSAGREAKERFESSGVDYDPEFTEADLATLRGEWSWLNTVVSEGMKAGPYGAIDDDLAYVAPWTRDPREITAPVLLVHGARDGIVPSAHSEWLARRCPNAELWLTPDDGHISVLGSATAALEWLHTHATAT